jgi:hypothetical protein
MTLRKRNIASSYLPPVEERKIERARYDVQVGTADFAATHLHARFERPRHGIGHVDPFERRPFNRRMAI